VRAQAVVVLTADFSSYRARHVGSVAIGEITRVVIVDDVLHYLSPREVVVAHSPCCSGHLVTSHIVEKIARVLVETRVAHPHDLACAVDALVIKWRVVLAGALQDPGGIFVPNGVDAALRGNTAHGVFLLLQVAHEEDEAGLPDPGTGAGCEAVKSCHLG